MATAYDVFVEKGYVATRVSDVTARLGVAHGTFYRYFDSKRDVFDDVIDFGVQRLVAEVAADGAPYAVETFEELERELSATLDRLFLLAAREPGLFRVLLLEATGVDDDLSARLLVFMNGLSVIAGTVLDHGVERGFVRGDLDTKAVARAFGAMLLPPVILALRGRLDAKARARHRDTLVALVADGTRVAGARP